MQEYHIIAHYHSNIYRLLKLPVFKNIKTTNIKAKRTEIIIKLGTHKNKQVAFGEAMQYGWYLLVLLTFFQNFDWYIDTFGSKNDQRLLFVHLWSFIISFWIVEF